MKISVITVCLNSERTIEKTIQSIIRQNYADYEYIVIDGGSTDGTLEILRKYRKNISIMVSEPDHGIYDAMNKGIDLAAGEVIGIINSDDWYEPDALETIGEYFQKSDAEVIYGKANIFGEKGKTEVQVPGNIERLRYEMTIPHPSVFVKKDVYRRYGTFRQIYKVAADYELMLRLYTRGIKFLCLDKVLANFRHGGVSELQWKRAAEETLEIARDYLSCAPIVMRKALKDIITHRYKALCFDKILDDFPYLIMDSLASKSGVGSHDKIAVFGAGNWGMKACEILSQKGMSPVFLVDNDEKKWCRNDDDRTVQPPESLKSFQGVLLVLVKEFSTEILLQVENIGNPEIYCITWEEIALDCMMKEKL